MTKSATAASLADAFERGMLIEAAQMMRRRADHMEAMARLDEEDERLSRSNRRAHLARMAPIGRSIDRAVRAGGSERDILERLAAETGWSRTALSRLVKAVRARRRELLTFRRDRTVLRLAQAPSMTNEVIAARLGISARTVSRIIAKHCNRMPRRPGRLF